MYKDDVTVKAYLTAKDFSALFAPSAVLGSSDANVEKITVGEYEIFPEEEVYEYNITRFFKAEEITPPLRAYTTDLSAVKEISSTEDNGVIKYTLKTVSCDTQNEKEYKINLCWKNLFISFMLYICFFNWYFYHFTSEDEEGRHGDSYHQDGNGGWYKGGVSSSVGDNANNPLLEIYKGMYQQLTYEESTGVYTITEYTLEGQDAMDILLKGPGFGSAETVNGTAYIIFHKVEIELKDGYIYRAYVDMEMYVEITAEYAGESVSLKMEGTMKEEAVYTDYGTTVVTLPNVTE